MTKSLREWFNRASVHIGQGRPSELSESTFHLLLEQLENLHDSGFSVDGETPPERACYKTGLSAERDGLYDVAPGSDAAVYVHFLVRLLCYLYYSGQRKQSRWAAVKHAAAVVRTYDCVGAVVETLLRIFRG